MSTHFGLVAELTFANANEVGAFLEHEMRADTLTLLRRKHPRWLATGAPAGLVSDRLRAIAGDSAPFFVRTAKKGKTLSIRALLSEDLDVLPTVVAVLRVAGSVFGARALGRLVALDDGPVLEIHVEGKTVRLVDDDVDDVDLAELVRDLASHDARAPAPRARTQTASSTTGDRGLFGWLLFPSDRGRSARAFAASTITGDLPTTWVEVAPVLLGGSTFVPKRAEQLVADSRSSAIARPELLDITTDLIELKIHTLLGPARAAEWIPKLLALLRVANTHGAQGDVVVVDVDGTDGIVIELRKKTMHARPADDVAIKKTLGWSLRKTLRQLTSR